MDHAGAASRGVGEQVAIIAVRGPLKRPSEIVRISAQAAHFDDAAIAIRRAGAAEVMRGHSGMVNHSLERPSDLAEVMIAGHEPPRVRIGYSRTFSLYQTVVALALGRKEVDLGLPPDPNWGRAAAQVRELRSPLGPFNYFEFALLSTASVDDFRHNLEARAQEFAHELSDALASVDELYQRDVWPTQQAVLDAALRDVDALLTPRKDRLIADLSALLGVAERPAVCSVTLVPACHLPMGGYSHPTVLDVTRFRGSQLLEALIHELSHVFMAEAANAERSSYSMFRDAIRTHGRFEREAAELFHLLIFRACGRLVRQSGLPDHTPIGEERDVYERTRNRLGITLTPEVIDLALAHWEGGVGELSGVIAALADAVPRGREGEPRRNDGGQGQS